MNTAAGQIDVSQEFSDKLTVHKNLGQDVIVTTADKVRLCLLSHRDALAKKHEWLMPLSLLVSFATTLVAADFKKFILQPAVWQALFILSALICLGWLTVSSKRAWQNRNAGNIDKIIRELMLRQPDA